MCWKVELFDKRIVLGVVVAQIIPQMMQFQQLHQHQIEVDSLGNGNLSSIQPTLCHLIDFMKRELHLSMLRKKKQKYI